MEGNSIRIEIVYKSKTSIVSNLPNTFNNQEIVNNLIEWYCTKSWNVMRLRIDNSLILLDRVNIEVIIVNYENVNSSEE